jgi:hypothetical protein
MRLGCKRHMTYGMAERLPAANKWCVQAPASTVNALRLVSDSSCCAV